jgi:DNA polymerase III subunit epsilon
VQPSDRIPADATLIHGIDDASVIDAPTWDEVYPLVGRILDQAGPVVIYNADFDVRILEQTNRLYGLPHFNADWRCAMKQFAAYSGVWHDRYQTWRWQKLSNALQMMGLPSPVSEHRALADAQSCRELVEAMDRGIVPISISPAALDTVATDDRSRQRDQGASEPLRPDVIRPGETWGDERAETGYETRSGTFMGGRYTVISTRPNGCSPGLLAAILIGGTIVIFVGCCLFFYTGARFLA